MEDTIEDTGVPGEVQRVRVLERREADADDVIPVAGGRARCRIDRDSQELD